VSTTATAQMAHLRAAALNKPAIALAGVANMPAQAGCRRAAADKTRLGHLYSQNCGSGWKGWADCRKHSILDSPNIRNDYFLSWQMAGGPMRFQSWSQILPELDRYR
jgi:hypothetical protein